MQEYVAGFMFDDNNRVALVRKAKPDWQRGLLNGIGGKIEFGEETPLFAMRREWREETGDGHMDWHHFVSICGEPGADWRVHFFIALVFEMPSFPPLNDIGEPIVVIEANGAEQRADIIPNLKWLLPLARDNSGSRIVMPNSTELYGAIPNVQRGLPQMQEQPRR